MTINHIDDQLEKGLEAWLYMAAYQAVHETMPPNFKDFLDLPLAVTNPLTEAKRVVLIRNLTPKDILDWTANHEIETQAQHLTELEGL